MSASDYDFVYNPNRGLGDAISCFNSAIPCWSPSKHFQTLKKYSSLPTTDNPQGRGLQVDHLHFHNFQGQHLFNRLRMATGLSPLTQPRAQLDLCHWQPRPKQIAFSWSVGQEANYQRQHVHPRARELYPEYRAVFEQWVADHRATHEFVEIGLTSSGIAHTTDMTNVGLDLTIKILEQSQKFIGMHSGLMHLATAIGLPCMIAVNFPQEELFDFDDALAIEQHQEMHWLYPQHEYLHEDALAPQRQFTRQRLDQWLA